MYLAFLVSDSFQRNVILDRSSSSIIDSDPRDHNRETL